MMPRTNVMTRGPKPRAVSHTFSRLIHDRRKRGISAGQRRPSAATSTKVLAEFATMPATPAPIALTLFCHAEALLLVSAYWTVLKPVSQAHQTCGAKTSAHVMMAA